MSTRPGRNAIELAIEAVRSAVEDAGLTMGDVDGLLVNRSQVPGGGGDVDLDLARRLGLQDLSVLLQLECRGATAGVMLAEAFDIVRSRAAQVVVAVFADAPLTEGRPSGSAFAQYAGSGDVRALERASGLLGAVPAYALVASRHQARYGTTSDDLGHVAVTARAWARGNSRAVAREPLTMEEYHASRVVASPLRRLDCARPVNGAAAVVVTTRRGPLPGVELVGDAAWHPGRRRMGPGESWFDDGPIPAGDRALAAAGRSRSDIDVIELYDPFTIVTLCLLEGYGFCEPGQAAGWFHDGVAAPGGSRPVNTGGGQLSGWYLQGMTPVVEALQQVRGAAGDRQVPETQTAFVATMGGRLDHHAVLVFSREA